MDNTETMCEGCYGPIPCINDCGIIIKTETPSYGPMTDDEIALRARKTELTALRRELYDKWNRSDKRTIKSKNLTAVSEGARSNIKMIEAQICELVEARKISPTITAVERD